MKLFNILAVLITLSAVFSYINYRFIKLPTTIGVMAISLLGSLGITLLGPLGFGLEEDALRLLDSIDFDETLLHGMLSFLLFAKEALGGIVYGLLIGGIAYGMLKSVANYQVEVLITLALVAGGYALADALLLSGPIAIVVAGLLIGNHGRLLAMSDGTRGHLDTFWELVDEVLNVVLFVLIGLEVLVLSWNQSYLIASVLMIPLLLLSRFVSVAVPIVTMRRFRTFSPSVIKILTWGGLRGGISVAMALSLPPGRHRDIILTIAYTIVVFSIIVQGLTIGKLVEPAAPTTEKTT